MTTKTTKSEYKPRPGRRGPAPGSPAARGPRTVGKYPWREWFARTPLVLLRGRDFKGLPHGMARTAIQAAARHGLRVSTMIGENTVTVHIRGRIDPPSSPQEIEAGR